MKRFHVALLLIPLSCHAAAEPPPAPVSKPQSLFDGDTLAGWEGNAQLWRIEDASLTGGSYVETVKRNEFLATTRDFTNFVIRFQIKLTGSNGFINSGFQIRSQRVPNNSEMAGYQCDYGEPNWYGAIYDESRRDKVMSASDMKALRPVLKLNDWNNYVIRADGPRVTTWINGVMGTDYTELDPAIPDWGKMGIQIHGGGKGVVQVRQIAVEELPPTAPGKIFRGAPEPKKGADNTGANRGAAQTASKAEPVTPEEELSRFTVAPGFEIELVASEDIAAGVGKFVTVDWDQHGNLWTMTALEYPVDGNENAAAARELYASKARDKVLVYDRDPKSPTGYATKARVFAEGLAIPLGILPYKNGVYVQHGTEIVFLSDTDGNGKADKREVILSGFGVQDSHLFPHQFTRAPGGWIWLAQGAFNYGKVKSTDGVEQQFDQTRMAKFRYGGSSFEITSQGPCNIWGLFMTMEGETWIQEANDYGYPAMPFHEYANYPGCSDAQWKSYAPEFPGTAPNFQMGGTGLSGLAMTDKFVNDEFRMTNGGTTLAPDHSSFVIRHSSWPEAYCDVIYIANPITRKIQAIKAKRDGPRYTLAKLPDFIQSSDEMFRPVALRLGPDGCLYFVDWYNKIISHNEVPRNHPERDKKRGRVWRVRPSDFKPLDVPDFTKLSGDELIAKLGGENTTQSHLAWQAIGDRKAEQQIQQMAPKLKALIFDKTQATPKRIASLWALEAMWHWGDFKKPEFTVLLAEADRNIRRETVRILGNILEFPDPNAMEYLEPLASDPDPQVRAEVIGSTANVLRMSYPAAGEIGKYTDRPTALLIRMAREALAEPTARSTQSGRTIKIREAYEREFERYLVRRALELNPLANGHFFYSEIMTTLPTENQLVALLAFGDWARSVQRIAQLLPQLNRPPNQEELLVLAKSPNEPGVGDALKKILQQPATSTAAIESLLKVRTKLDAAKITPLLNDAAKQLLAQDKPASVELGARLVASFQLAALEPELVQVLKVGQASRLPGTGGTPVLLSALRALREIKSADLDLFAQLAKESSDPVLQNEAVSALAASRDPRGPQQLASLYPSLPAAPRRTALASLAGTRPGAQATVKAVRAGTIGKDDLDAATLDKLHAVLGDDKELAALMEEMASFFRPALRLDGSDSAWSETDITLDGPFTVETWVKLDPGIDNNDGILGAPGVLDMNFFGALFRVWVGTSNIHDAIIAKKKITADVWTHVAVTRDGDGKFRIYQNGELDTDDGKAVKDKFEHCRIAWTAPAKGTAGWLSEFRVWNRARTAEELRADFDRSFSVGQASRLANSTVDPAAAGGTPALLYSGTNWSRLHSGAKVSKTADFPPLLTTEESKALAAKFTGFHTLANKTGDQMKGKALFTSICQQCHSVGGQGGQVGPVLNGAGALGVEALLRNILTPSAAMEPGYRLFRIELKDGDVLDGILVSQNPDAILLRRPNIADTRIPQADVRKASFTKKSLMPDGLLETLPPEQVTDLFTFLKTLK